MCGLVKDIKNKYENLHTEFTNIPYLQLAN